MGRRVAIEKIEKEIDRLIPQEQLNLVERVFHHLRKTGLAVKKELKWDKLYGLGKGLWKGKDAQDYVNRMRADRI